MAICWAGPGDRPFRHALRAAAFARPEAQFQAAGIARRIHPLHARRGCLLAGSARFRQRLLYGELDGFCRAHRTRRHLVVVFPGAIGKAAVDAAQRPATGGSFAAWQRIVTTCRKYTSRKPGTNAPMSTYGRSAN